MEALNNLSLFPCMKYTVKDDNTTNIYNDCRNSEHILDLQIYRVIFKIPTVLFI